MDWHSWHQLLQWMANKRDEEWVAVRRVAAVCCEKSTQKDKDIQPDIQDCQGLLAKGPPLQDASTGNYTRTSNILQPVWQTEDNEQNIRGG